MERSNVGVENRQGKLNMAIGYVRVSTCGQAADDRFGIDAQKSAIIDYASKNGYEITDFVIDTISGVKEVREGFDKILMGEVETDAVIVYKSDRVARDIKLYFYYLYTLEKHGIKLISVTEEFDEDGGLANVYRAILQFVAEQERNNIRLRTMAGRKQKLRKGGYAGGNYPTGYFLADGKLYADGEERRVVRTIFKLYYEGLGCTRISWELNRRKIKTKRGFEWFDASVARVLKNRKFYEGFVLVDGEYVKGEHEPILDVDEFRRPDYDFYASRLEEEHLPQIKGCTKLGNPNFYKKKEKETE